MKLRHFAIATATPFFVIALTGGMCGMNNNGIIPTTSIPLVYGNGSAGDKVVSSDENWNNAAVAPTNLQFTTLTINPGVTLTLPSGMTIRCTESFTNHGAIVVLPGADGGFAGQDGPASSDDLSDQVVDPVAGIGTIAAQAGETGGMNDSLAAGRGGFGISEFEARQVFQTVLAFGGGGAAAGSDSGPGGIESNFGSSGGGGVTVLAAGMITNSSTGSIQADGASGSGGGGAGGGILLASMTGITHDGTASATGGDGEDGDSNEAPSGGGGGGLIHLLAPMISGSGTTDVSGGNGGSNAAAITVDDDRFAGGGGGGSGGSGGNGGGIPSGPQPTGSTPATAGASGFALQTLVDPSSLF